MLLEKISQPSDLKKLTDQQLNILAAEIRQFILKKTSVTGGHLASNLGSVELTIGMMRALDLPEDKIVWDVGHQCYTYKILTGRRERFDTLRQYKGLSGFPKRSESQYDSFNTGHSSTSVSAGLGMALGRDIRHEDYTVVSVIGDGALTGGMAFEGLNNAAAMKKNFIIVLNDNTMSISKNIGGMSHYLDSIRAGKGYNELKDNVEELLNKVPNIGQSMIRQMRKTKSMVKQLLIPGMLFENMGLTYLGPVDGHDIRQVEQAIRDAKKLDHAVIVHVLTKKGKGYRPAEVNPAAFHGVDPFDLATGKPLAKKAKSYTKYFSEQLVEEGKAHPELAAITAAMPDGTGLSAFQKAYPERFFDVGIAEQNAVTMAAGMACSGIHPVVAIYSSFLQRAYDQISHDVCMQKLPVIFALDRAGFVGSDGETHHGIFDYSYLSHLPNMTIMAPKNGPELQQMLHFAVDYDLPIAIRYPRGEAFEELLDHRAPIEYGKGEIIYEGEGTALLAVGSMMSCACHLYDRIRKELGKEVTLVNMRFVKPVDTELLDELAKKCHTFVTMEENVLTGGMGWAINDYMMKNHPKCCIINVAIPDRYIEQGNIDILKENLGMDSESILNRIKDKI